MALQHSSYVGVITGFMPNTINPRYCIAIKYESVDFNHIVWFFPDLAC